MYKKEFMDSARQAVAVLSFLLLLPIFLFIDLKLIHSGVNHRDVTLIYYQLMISIITMVFTISLFGAEKRDNAMEYLLNLPVTRQKIIGYKLIPRFSILAVLYIILILIQGQKEYVIKDNMVTLIHPSVMPIVMFTLLIFGFIGGLIGHNCKYFIFILLFSSYIAIGGATAIASYFIDIRMDQFRIEGFMPCFLISNTVVLLILWLSFSPVFRRYDLKPQGLHLKKFGWFVLPPLVLVAAVVVISLFINIRG